MSEPKDLGVKIGTKDQVLWTSVLKNSELQKKTAEDTVQIQTEVIELAKKRIEEEKAKFK